MSRVELLSDEALPEHVRAQVQATEARGADASVLRGLAHNQPMFDKYFQFYYPTHQAGIIEPALKELVRLKIARLNDCFT